MEKRFVYADNAATTAVSDRVMEVMMPFFKEQYGNPSAVHSKGRESRRAVEEARKKIAECINCHPSEIYFTSGGTESDNIALFSALKQRSDGRGHIITTAFEHKAVLEPCKELERLGIKVTYIVPDSNGMITSQQVENAIREDTVMVSVMAANNEVGTIMPVEDIGRVCRKHGIVFHTDAVQAVGKIEIDVQKQFIDIMSISGHKITAPKGIGAVYVRTGVKVWPVVYGGGQEKKLRSGTENVAGIAALGEAVSAAGENIAERAGAVAVLRDRLINGLENLGGRLNGDRENRLCGNASIAFDGFESETMLLMLDMRGICASGGSACSSGNGVVSHVLKAIGASDSEAKGTLRFTLSEENTAEDVDCIIEAMEDVLGRLKKLKEM